MTRKPDFIVIGAMKCATSTLHQQLARQSGIFMSRPKEPNFFSDDAVWDRGVEWYGSLFTCAESTDICGESSTHYTKLPTHARTVERIKATCGMDVRLIYVMRHPVDRFVSHYMHEWAQGIVKVPIEEAAEKHRELTDYGRYAMQLAPYVETFGEEFILPVFFDRLTAEPVLELMRICRFIGYDGTVTWDDGAGRENVSNKRVRRTPLRSLLLDNQRIRGVARALVPKRVRDVVEEAWAVKARPELSDNLRSQLEETFDEDLRILGKRLGIDLSCRNFKEVGSGTEARWGGEALEQAA